MSVNIFSEMLGKTMSSVHESDSAHELIFEDTQGNRYVFKHEQDCCESVRIEDICGELTDLEGSPMLLAEEVSEDEPYAPNEDSYTWTFYKFATIKGTVTVRWLGTSNGYYSESVSYCFLRR